MRYSDAHNHLQLFSEEIIQQIDFLDITIVNGSNISDWERVIELSDRYQWVRASLGVHPWNVTESKLEDLKYLEELISREKAILVGEIGLDKNREEFEKQKNFFEIQLRIAKKFSRTVSIHCVKAWSQLIQVLGAAKLEKPFLLHSFAGRSEDINRLVELGGYFSLSGGTLRSDKVCEVFKKIPLDRVLLETDAPSQPVQIELDEFNLMSGEKRLNHPGNIQVVYRLASEVLGINENELEIVVEENLQNFLS